MAARLPEQMAFYMQTKVQQLDDPESLQLYRDIVEAIGWDPDDPRLIAVVDRLAASFDAAYDAGWDPEDDGMPDELVHLLDSVFLDSVPAARRILELLEERGWRGWTRLERIDPKV